MYKELQQEVRLKCRFSHQIVNPPPIRLNALNQLAVDAVKTLKDERTTIINQFKYSPILWKTHKLKILLLKYYHKWKRILMRNFELAGN